MGLIYQFFKGRESDAVRHTAYPKETPPQETPVVSDGGENGASGGPYTYRPGGGEGVKPTRETSFPREGRRTR